MRVLFLNVVLAATLLAGSAFAAPLDGTRLAYVVRDNNQGNWVWSGEVRNGELKLAEGQKFGHKSRSLYPGCFLHCNRSSHPVQSSKIFDLFPLKRGNGTKFYRSRANGSATWLHSMKVAGQRTFNSKALGRIDVVVFKTNISGKKGVSFRGRTVSYWSPELELVVYEKNTGGNWVNEIHLQSYQQ